MGREPSHPFKEDRDLLDRFRAGDRGALEQVYWAYIDPVERLVRRYLSSTMASGPPGTSLGVEDLVQDVFTRAFSRSARQSYDGLRDYDPYLFTIARHVVADALRLSHREVLTDLEHLFDSSTPTDTDWYHGSLDLADPLTMACVRDYIAKLSPELDAVYRQRYVIGLSQDASAAAIGSSRQRFRTLEKKLRAGLSRALKVQRGQDRRMQLSAAPAWRRE